MGTSKKLLIIDNNFSLLEYDVPNKAKLEEREKCIIVCNILIPFHFFQAVQLCDEKQYEAIKEGLA